MCELVHRLSFRATFSNVECKVGRSDTGDQAMNLMHKYDSASGFLGCSAREEGRCWLNKPRYSVESNLLKYIYLHLFDPPSSTESIVVQLTKHQQWKIKTFKNLPWFFFLFALRLLSIFLPAVQSTSKCFRCSVTISKTETIHQRDVFIVPTDHLS